MKVVKIDLPSEVKDNELKIFPLSDVHIDDPNCNIKKLLEWREEVLNTENGYVVINGDICNMALKNSKSDIYSASMTPDKAIDTVVEFLKPIKDRIISACSGNHDSRAYKEAGIDPIKRICRELDIEDRYHPHACVVFVSFGKSLKRDCRKQPYVIFHRHGNVGGKRIGGKANALEDMLGIIDADLYIISHTHQAMTFKKNFYRCDYRNKKITAIEKTFVNSNAWLDYENSYAVALGCSPSSQQYPVITLKGETKKIEVKL